MNWSWVTNTMFTVVRNRFLIEIPLPTWVGTPQVTEFTFQIVNGVIKLSGKWITKA